MAQLPLATSLKKSPVQRYNTLQEVIAEVVSATIIDLAEYTHTPSVMFLEAAMPPPRGVYIQGRLAPLLSFDHHDYYANTPQGQIRILDFESFVAQKSAVFDAAGQLVHSCPARYARTMSPHCSYNYIGVYLAVIAVVVHLEALSRAHGECQDSLVSINLPPEFLSTSSWVRDDSLYFTPADDLMFSPLRPIVDRFVGHDILNTYTLRLNNTHLAIEKGNDFRVIEYYRRIFEQHETERFELHGY